MKDDKENKTYNVQYTIDIPVVIFSYKTKLGEKETVFEQRYAYNSMFEKFGIKKEDSDEKNPEKICQALEKCFTTKKVTFESSPKTNSFAIDFRAEDDHTIFKAFLESTLRTNQATLKEKPDQKKDIQWEISIPNVIFCYTDENGVTFEEKLDYNCMFEKFGMKQGEEDKKNGFNLQGTITRHFYQNKVFIETVDMRPKKSYAIEFKGENDTTLFKVFLKPKMNCNVVNMKDQPDKKFCVEWVIDIPDVIFTLKENKDGKEVVRKAQLDYNCTFEKFGVKKEEKDNNNPMGLTSVMKKYFDEGKVIMKEYSEGHQKFNMIEFTEDGSKTLFQLPLK